MSKQLTDEEAALIDGSTGASVSQSADSADNDDDFTSTTMMTALSEPPEQIEWLIDGLLSVGGISMWQAKPFVGKSTTMRTAALKVSRGEPFLGRATRKVAVGYLALEERRSEVIAHFRKMGATGDEQLCIHTGLPPVQDVFEKLRRFIVNNKLKLAFIDPIVLILIRKVSKLNEYGDVYAALAPLISIARDSGCHIAFVHHMGKADRDSTDQTMGSTAFAAAVDTQVILRKDAKGNRSIETVQRRAGANIPPTTLRLDLATEVVDIGDPAWLTKKNAAFETVRDFLRRQPVGAVFERKALAVASKVKGKSLDAALKRGLDEKSFMRLGSGRSGDAFKYRTAAPGDEARQPTLTVVKKNRKFAK